MTAQGEKGDATLPKWNKTTSEEVVKAQQGNQAASLISNALQSMGWGANPWAGITGTVMR